MKRGHVLAAWRCMCKNDWETGDHLLLHCEIATALWGFVFQMFGIQWVLPVKVIELLFGWFNWFEKHFIRHLKPCSALLNVVVVAKEELSYFQRQGEILTPSSRVLCESAI
jgi:hypothetical protein